MKLLHKIILLTVVLSLFGAGTVLGVTYVHTQSQTYSGAATRQLYLARSGLGQLESYFDDRQLSIRSMAGRFEYASAVQNTNMAVAAVESMNQIRAVNPAWTSMMLVDTKSQIRAATLPADKAGKMLTDSTTSALYQQALAGKTVRSDVYYDKVQGRSVVALMTPLQSKDAVIGVLAGTVDWSVAVDMLATINASQVYLFSKDGDLLGSNNTEANKNILTANYSAALDKRQLKTQSETVQMSAFDGSNRQMFVTYTAESGRSGYKAGDWLMTVGTPSSEVFAPVVRQTLMLSAAVIFVMGVITIIMFWVLRREVVRPLGALNAALMRVSLGDLSQTAEPLPGGEIGALGRSFNEMVRQLTNSHRSLYQATQVAAEGQAQLEASIDGLRQGFILTDPEGKSIMTNEAARQLLRQVRSKHDADTEIATLNALFAGKTDIVEAIKHTLTKRKQSRYPNLAIGGRFVNLYLSPVISKDHALGCVLLIEDVTEERILQRSRDEFFSIASHELRTPLTAIRGNTAIMREYFPEVLKNPDMSEMVGDIHESSVRLIAIVNDFLDASRLEQNKMQFELKTFKIEPIIERVIYEMTGMNQANGVSLNFDQYTLGDLPAVHADENRVKQVLYNLIGNAMKFTTKGSVTINCLVQNKKLKVCVTDTGPGISPEGQQLLFHKFQQTGENLFTRDATRGTGLGLYISKLLLEHMGGEIKLEHSTIGQGTTFSFTLPVAPSHAATSKPEVK